MTNRKLRRSVGWAIALWLFLAIVLAVLPGSLRDRLQGPIGLVALIPAPLLGFEFQRRLAHVRVLDEFRAGASAISRDLLRIVESLGPMASPSTDIASAIDQLRTLLLNVEALGISGPNDIEDGIRFVSVQPVSGSSRGAGRPARALRSVCVMNPISDRP